MAERRQSLPPDKVADAAGASSSSSSSAAAGTALPRKVGYPNPPDAVNPDASTLRDQWRFAIRQYSKWYSHAWGTAILAGMSFFALGWIIKGSNPLPSRREELPREEDTHALGKNAEVPSTSSSAESR
ncbi:unnamed protein product [Victoria cruziana]